MSPIIFSTSKEKSFPSLILLYNLRSFGGRSGFLFLVDDLHVGGGGRDHPPDHLRPLHQPALRKGEEARQRRTRECEGRGAHSQV